MLKIKIKGIDKINTPFISIKILNKLNKKANPNPNITPKGKTAGKQVKNMNIIAVIPNMNFVFSFIT
jgi:hypothetical protein